MSDKTDRKSHTDSSTEACDGQARLEHAPPVPRELVSPERVFQVARHGLGALTHAYGGILFVRPDGRIASKGSMVLAKTQEDHFVFTAKHVARELHAGRGFINVRPPTVTAEDALRGVFHAPVLYPITSADVVWMSNEMDIAALRAPPAMMANTHLRWFDAEACIEATRSVRKLQNDSEHPLLTVIMGCPNWGHVREGGQETVSFVPMYTYISRIELHSWDGVSRVPQIHLEVDDGSKRPQRERTGFPALLLSALRDENPDRPRLAGFSGGPLVAIGTDGEFLIGIVTEGDYVFGTEARAFGIAWDDVMLGFKRALS